MTKLDTIGRQILTFGIATLALLIAGGLTRAQPMQTQPQSPLPGCGGISIPHAIMTERLLKEYQETPISAALSQLPPQAGGGTVLVEIYTSDKGTWTFIQVRNDSLACVMVAGDTWVDLPQTLLPNSRGPVYRLLPQGSRI